MQLRLSSFYYKTFQQTVQLQVWTTASHISTAGFKILQELRYDIHTALLTIYTQNMLIQKKKHSVSKKDQA